MRSEFELYKAASVTDGFSTQPLATVTISDRRTIVVAVIDDDGTVERVRALSDVDAALSLALRWRRKHGRAAVFVRNPLFAGKFVRLGKDEIAELLDI